MVLLQNSFHFRKVVIDDVYEVLKSLNPSKAFQNDNIPPSYLRDNADVCAGVICNDVNRGIEKGCFPANLKKADITPIFKKGDRLLKTNYRPVSILATLAKVYEKLLYPQIYDYFDRIFSKYLGGFRKAHSTQHCLLIMLEKLRGALDKGLVTGILLTDLSKAFDSISHELLAAKLYAYGFSKNSVKLIYDYLSGRTHRTKVNNSFGKWLKIMFGLPQGSILGVILFNIYINDLFFSAEFQMANFADDCSPFDSGAYH